MKPGPETTEQTPAVAAAPQGDGPVAGPRKRTDRWSGRLGVLGLVVGAVVLPSVLSEYNLYLATQVVIYAIATMGLNVLFGKAGQLSLAQATFFGIGAYTTAILYNNTLLPIAAEIPIAVIVSGLTGLIVGIAALRVRGLRLAVVTLAFSQLFTWWLIYDTDLTGGQQGLFLAQLVIEPLSPEMSSWVAAVVVAVLLTVLTLHLPRTAVGRMMLAVRESEAAALSVGGSLVRPKLAAFVISACFGGIAGWLFAHTVGSIAPGTFGLFPSVYFLVAVIIGGTGSVFGSWLGAAYLIMVPEIVTSAGYNNLYALLSGMIMIVVIVLLPGGVRSLMTRDFWRRLRTR